MSARQSVAPRSAKTRAHAAPMPCAAPTSRTRFPSSVNGLLDAATRGHHPTLCEHPVRDHGDTVCEVDDGTDVVRDDRHAVADPEVGRRGKLDQAVLFAQAAYVGARIS